MECPFCKREVEEEKLKNYQGVRMCLACLAKSLEGKHSASRTVTAGCGCDHDHDDGGCGSHDHDFGGGCGGHGDKGGGGCGCN